MGPHQGERWGVNEVYTVSEIKSEENIFRGRGRISGVSCTKGTVSYMKTLAPMNKMGLPMSFVLVE